MEQIASQVDGTLAGQDTALGELVQRAQHGEHAAFAALFERYNAPLCRYLVRLVGNVEIGHDLAQDTFLKAWRSLPTCAMASASVPGCIKSLPIWRARTRAAPG
jgi:hypothetical protein